MYLSSWISSKLNFEPVFQFNFDTIAHALTLTHAHTHVQDKWPSLLRTLITAQDLRHIWLIYRPNNLSCAVRWKQQIEIEPTLSTYKTHFNHNDDNNIGWTRICRDKLYICRERERKKGRKKGWFIDSLLGMRVFLKKIFILNGNNWWHARDTSSYIGWYTDTLQLQL